MRLRIRHEQPEDIALIHVLTREAFKSMPHAAGTEQDIVDTLRAERALAVSLVAEMDDVVVGHVAFSPVTVDGMPSRWLALGPLSVKPRCQRQGVGSGLVRAGLACLTETNAVGCVLVGDPGYYSRFGFGRDERLVLADMPPAYSLALRLRPSNDAGVVRFHPAFSNPRPCSSARVHD